MTSSQRMTWSPVLGPSQLWLGMHSPSHRETYRNLLRWDLYMDQWSTWIDVSILQFICAGHIFFSCLQVSHASACEAAWDKLNRCFPFFPSHFCTKLQNATNNHRSSKSPQCVNKYWQAFKCLSLRFRDFHSICDRRHSGHWLLVLNQRPIHSSGQEKTKLQMSSTGQTNLVIPWPPSENCEILSSFPQVCQGSTAWSMNPINPKHAKNPWIPTLKVDLHRGSTWKKCPQFGSSVRRFPSWRSRNSQTLATPHATSSNIFKCSASWYCSKQIEQLLSSKKLRIRNVCVSDDLPPFPSLHPVLRCIGVSKLHLGQCLDIGLCQCQSHLHSTHCPKRLKFWDSERPKGLVSCRFNNFQHEVAVTQITCRPPPWTARCLLSVCEGPCLWEKWWKRCC